MIKHIQGNILSLEDTKDLVIVQQVNCLGVMGAGLALQIRKKYPNVFEEYYQYCLKGNKQNILGNILLVDTADNIIVANLFSQLRYGAHARQTNYEAFYVALEKLKAECHDKVIAFPYKIGCGLAGGNWKIIETMIEEVFHDKTVLIVEYK